MSKAEKQSHKRKKYLSVVEQGDYPTTPFQSPLTEWQVPYPQAGKREEPHEHYRVLNAVPLTVRRVFYPKRE